MAVDALPTKIMILNNQHLGMVVQWEDRFYKANRAHTYLGRRVRFPSSSHGPELSSFAPPQPPDQFERSAHLCSHKAGHQEACATTARAHDGMDC